MAFQTIQVNLEFNANTAKAKQQMAELQQQLTSLSTMKPSSNLSITPQIQQAQQAAMQLKVALNNATNIDTGKLNLSQFQTQLKMSGMSLQQMAVQMRALGPEGVKSFSQLTSIIAQADTRMFSLGAKTKSFLTSIAHSAKYQLASSMIYGTINAFNKTLDYAKELDTSLNNIRIVTGKGADEMARFAKEANKMAKQLSTTTTKYTDASLIYYQQGLDDQEVAERTNTTVKLANVVGVSAQEASEWMTAIWNNFDDGSEKLEYYADVLAKLGANTASSADEIATGLEKFAAVADTVGLSYEYAASALATITAETRQSADVVGTALKTLFARIEGLKFGDTLEDGTTLNQYSLALQKVGVNIKDTNNELKDMDVILDETGARWDSLAKDEQVALAQSVAGIRQYTQFMALMDNWDVMKNNIEMTETANGALEEQQSIYEESTKAAQERMRTASEELKTVLIGGDDMASAYNFFGNTLELVAELLDSFGGLRTIILAAVAALMNMYQPQVATFMANLATNAVTFGQAMKNGFTRKGFQANTDYKVNAVQMGANMVNDALPEGAKTSYYTKENAAIETKMLELSNSINSSVKQRLQWQFDLIKSHQSQVELMERELEVSKETTAANAEKITNAGVNSSTIMSQATSLGQMKGYGQQAANIIDDAKSTGPLNETSRQAIAFQASNSLNKATAAATTGLNGMTGVGMDLSKINITLDDEMMSVEEATRRANEALNNYAQTGQEDLSKLLAMIEQINKAMSESGTSQIAQNKQNILNSQTFGEMGQKYQNTNTSVNVNQVEQDLNQIDGRKLSVKSVSTGSGTAPITKKNLQNQVKDIKKLQVEQKKYNKTSKEYQDIQTKINAKTKTLTSQMKKFLGAQKNNNKTTQRNTKENQELSQSIDNVTASAEKEGQAMVGLETAEKGVADEMLNLNGALNNGGSGFKHWSDSLSSGLGTLSSAAMGISMLTSAFTNLGETIASGEGDWQSYISILSSVLMSSMMLLPVFTKVIAGIRNKQKAKQQEKIMQDTLNQTEETGLSIEQREIIMQKAQSGASKQEIADEYGEAGANVVSAYAKNAKNAGSVATWPAFVAGLAMIAPVALMVGASVIGGAASGNAEKEEEEVSEGLEHLESINETQELAASVTDLTEEYKALQAAGASTTDILKDMNDAIPDLIENYKELGKTLGSGLDTTQLEEAYEYFLKTGDISVYEQAQSELDAEIRNKEQRIAKTTADKASGLAMDALTDGLGYEDGTHFAINLTNGNSTTASILEDKLGEYWDGDELRFDMSNPGEALDAYEKMIDARDELAAQGLEETDTYEELNNQIKDASEHMASLTTAQQELYDLKKEELLELSGEGVDNFNLTDNNGVSINSQNIDTLAEYERYKADLIQQLKEEYEWTEAQAEAYLKTTEAFGKYEDAIDVFGEMDNPTARTTQIVDNVKEGLDGVKQWYTTLSEEERTLFLGIDFSTVTNIEEAKQQMEELREQASKAAILSEASKLEVDETTFETYAEGLDSINEGLGENKILTQQIALNNLKISKGLSTLTSNWDESYSILQKNNKASLEYAEAIGNIKSALTEMFGVKPSTDFVEKYKEEINQVVQGNLEGLSDLQDALAKDYVLNMEFNTAIDYGADGEGVFAGTIADAQNVLNSMLDDIDTSIEVGEGAYLSEDYLNTIQDMLDSGVISSEQLQQLFRAKGYELQITGWDEIDGPEKTITRTTYDADGVKTGSETIKESEKIKVPIINGDSSRIKSMAAGATKTDVQKGLSYTKSTDKRVIDTTSAQDKAEKAKDRKKDLQTEADRYHELNEEIKDNEQLLKKIGRAKDRAYGQQKLQYLKQEIEQQKILLKNNQQLLSDAEKYLKIDQQALINATSSQYALEFDEFGRLGNYEEIERAYLAEMEKVVNNDTLYEKREKEYEAWKKAAKQYEDTLNKTEETANLIDEMLDDIYDKNLETIELNVQVKMDIIDDNQAYIDFLMQKYEDDAFAIADAIKLLSNSTANSFERIAVAEQSLVDVQTAFENGDISAEQAAEKMREYRDTIIDANAELLELRNTVQEKLTESYDAWNEKLDAGISYLEHLGSITEAYQNIIDIAGKDNFGIDESVLADMRNTKQVNAQETLSATQDKLLANQDYLAQAKEALAKATNEDDKKYWEEQIQYAQEQVMSAESEFMDAWSTALEVAAENFSAHVQSIVETFSEEVSGLYGSLEELSEVFERQQEMGERYLEGYEKTYEISKLNRKIQQDISKTNSLAASKELRDLQEELLSLNQQGVNVSERDIQYMQKKYDLLLAEQALRDAQNAKSIVRLQQDSEGNYNYVYTADQNNIDSATQNYEDKLYALQQYNSESLLEIQNQIIAVNQEFAEAMANIESNATLSSEEKAIKMAELTEFYMSKLAYWETEAAKFTQYNADINKEYNTNMADNFNETILGRMYPDLTTWEEHFENSQQAMIDSSVEFIEAIEEYNEANKKTCEEVGVAYEGMGSDVADILKSMVQELDLDMAEMADIVQEGMEETSGEFEDGMRDMTGSAKTARSNIKTAAQNIRKDFLTEIKNMRSQSNQSNQGLVSDTQGKMSSMSSTVTTHMGKVRSQSKETSSSISTLRSQMQTNLSNGVTAVSNFQQTYSNKMATVRSQNEQTISSIGTLIQKYNDLAKAANQEFKPPQTPTTVTGGGTTTGGGSKTDLGKFQVGNSVMSRDATRTGKIKEILSNGRYKVEDSQGRTWTATADDLELYTKPAFQGYPLKLMETDPYEIETNADVLTLYYTDDGKTKYGSTWRLTEAQMKTLSNYKIIGYKTVKYGSDTHHLYRLSTPLSVGPYGDGGKDLKTYWLNQTDLFQLIGWTGRKGADFRSMYNIPSLDTGGYTGEWGPEGRLAMLHQKEIVLNAHDTENLLSIISMVRDMNDRIELNARAMQYGLTAAYTANNIKSQNDTLQQEVHITAEFPNATNHSEIEEAFRNLTNLASQYANRKF